VIPGGHGKDKRAVRPGEAASFLNDVLAEGVEGLEAPEGSALGIGLSVRGFGPDLKQACKVMGEGGCKEVGLIRDPASAGDVGHVALRLALSEEGFLGPASVMEPYHVEGVDGFVRHDDLEFVMLVMGYKQVELDGTLGALGDFLSDDEDAEVLRPGFGFPVRLEIFDPSAGMVPTASCLDFLFECGEAFEGDGDGELDAVRVEAPSDLVAEKGSIDADLDDGVGEHGPDLADASFHELSGSAGVMDVSAAMEEIENHAELGDGAKEGIVTALSFFLLVEAHGSIFCEAFGGLHGTVEIQGNACGTDGDEGFEDEVALGFPQFFDGGVIDLLEPPAQSAGGWDMIESKGAFDHGVVAVVHGVAELAEAEQNVNDQLKKDDEGAVDRLSSEVAKALMESFPKLDAVK